MNLRTSEQRETTRASLDVSATIPGSSASTSRRAPRNENRKNNARVPRVRMLHLLVKSKRFRFLLIFFLSLLLTRGNDRKLITETAESGRVRVDELRDDKHESDKWQYEKNKSNNTRPEKIFAHFFGRLVCAIRFRGNFVE